MAGGIGLMQVQVADEGSWRTQNFRQNMVAKIDEAIGQCGAPTSKSATEMENQVYSKANSKNEYLSFVARLILHIKEMGNKSKLPPGAQLQPTNTPAAMANQVNQLNAMTHSLGQMNAQGQPIQMTIGMMQQQAGIIPGGNMGQQGQGQGGPGNGIMMSQGQQVRLMTPGQVSVGGGGMMVGQPGGGGGMNVNMGQQSNPQQMQLGQQNQMINQNFVNQQLQQQQQQQQQIQSGIGQGGQMQGAQGGGMNNPQMQQQLQNAQMQQLHQQQGEQQQQPGVGRGIRMSTMQQMQHMPRKAMQHRPMNPSAMGISRPEIHGAYPMNRLIYMGSQQVDGGMASFQGGGPQVRTSSGPFLPPNASPGMSLGGPPSANSMVQGTNQPGFVNSPQSHPHGSPAPQQIQGGGIRPFGNQMVPSPSMNLNVSTPLPMVPTPSPRGIGQEELACQKKIEDLKRYTDMIQRMIIKIGNEDVEKSSKMKKLLDILMNPTRQVSMDLLLKCEAALKKMEKQQHEPGPASQPTMPPKDQISPFLQIQEALLTTLKNGSASHTFLRTFRPSIEALTGQSAIAADIPDDEPTISQDDLKCDVPPILLREFKMLGRRFPVTIHRRGRKLPIQINVSLGDPKLPRVPLLKIIIPIDYPDESPVLVDFKKDYSSTTFLSLVSQAFNSRKVLMSTKFTVYELLISWEMSVRQVANPTKRKVAPLKRLKNPNPIPATKGRLGLAYL